MSSLTSIFQSGSALTPDVIQDMWELRGAVMRMKPGVDLEADLAHFASICRRAQVISLLRDEGHVLRGMSVWIYEQKRWQGRKFLDLWPEYWMLDPAWRGHPVASRAGFRIALTLLLASRGRPIVSVNAAYLQSYVKLAPLVDFWTCADPDIPAWERSYLEHTMKERFAGWTPEDPLVEMKTLPPPLSEQWLAAHANDPAYLSYSTQNPIWSEGFALPAIAVTSLAMLRPLLRQNLRRAMRRIFQRSSSRDA